MKSEEAEASQEAQRMVEEALRISAGVAAKNLIITVADVIQQEKDIAAAITEKKRPLSRQERQEYYDKKLTSSGSE